MLLRDFHDLLALKYKLFPYLVYFEVIGDPSAVYLGVISVVILSQYLDFVLFMDKKFPPMRG